MGIKMDKTGIIVCSVVGSLGLLSAIFGFSAEGTKLTPYTILVLDDECIYPSNPALGLAICAAIFLVLAQVTISAVGGCCGCCKSRAIPSETKRIVGIICAVVSWIAAVVAVALLSEGASWNANVVRIGPAPICPYLKDGILAGGGVLALVATALGITSFILLRSQPAGAPNGIAIGQPQQYPSAAAKPNEQPPQAAEVIALGQFPSKPQVVPTTVSHAQGYVHAPPQMTPQFHPQPQVYGSHALNGHFPSPPLPQGHPPANMAPLPAGAPAVQSFSPPQVVYAQPQQQPPSYSPQHPAHQPHAYGVQAVPVPLPPVLPSQGSGEAEGQTGISTGGLFAAGAKLLIRVAEQSLSSNDNTNNADPATTTGDDVYLPSMGDSSTTQDAAQNTNYA
ncbi:hypothetical protein QOZ80_5AG0372060 [Eleusine coracana subsp. coracana]|nr:hypothetical protein QOZ80_5AG0372060 [Eleusine coracana subsp. coracana]